MAQITIFTPDNPDARDDGNSVTLNTIYHPFSANQWFYASGNSSLVNNATGGTWEDGGATTMTLSDRSGREVAELTLGGQRSFPRSNSFGSLPVGEVWGCTTPSEPNGLWWMVVAN